MTQVVKTIRGDQKKSWHVRLAGFTVSFGLGFCVVVLAFLALGSLIVTYSTDIGELDEVGICHTLLTAPTMLLTTLVPLALLLVTGFSLAHWEKCPDWRLFLAASCFLAALFQFWWVLGQGTTNTYYSDAAQLLRYGRALANDNAVDIAKLFNTALPSNIADAKPGTLYFMWYPFQLSGLAYYWLLFVLFGDGGTLAFQVINIFANLMAIVSLSVASRHLFRGNGGKACVSIALALCIPNLLYSSFFYCNQVGFGLVCTFVMLQVEAMKHTGHREQFSLIAASFIPFSLACWLKMTFFVVGLAVLVVWIIRLLAVFDGRSAVVFVLCVAVVLLGNYSSFIPRSVVETKLGYTFGDGMPKTAWIAIGLQDQRAEGTPKTEGWWNGFAVNTSMAVNNDYGDMSDLAFESIQERLETFVGDPFYALKFFGKKIGSEWFSPDFGAKYFAEINYSVDSGDEEVSFKYWDSGSSLQQRYNTMWLFVRMLRPFMDGFQTLIYALSAVGCVSLFRNRKNLPNHYLVFPCVFATGFMLYFLWEAKSQYTLPFFTCLVPVAVYGLESILKQRLGQNGDRGCSASFAPGHE